MSENMDSGLAALREVVRYVPAAAISAGSRRN